ncbi:MAG TPA: succinate dehydrogenase flavoprotein subunit [Thermomicrobiales bacterium]|nr:succinate dehydrogenase flavoprotein subunit [Thermomicrobiales bacterium]
MAFHRYDAVVVGAGGAGLAAAIQLADSDAHIACVTKLFPTRSHTGAAQGGIAASLGNTEEDHWEWHMYDTVKGGDYLVDQDAAEILVKDAIEAVVSLEHMGLPFNRTPDGKIDQRRFGGHTKRHGEGPVRRACYAADRTGHMILQTLYQNSIKHKVNFFDEHHLVDLLFTDDGQCCGVVTYELKTGELHVIQAKAVIIATGGAGRIFKITSNALASTGDGIGIAYRRGVPLMDMEFLQFHPTGLRKLGILVSEAARGEGGIVRNNDGEAFAARYAPTMKDLAPRDMMSRFIWQEIHEGRGINGEDYVLLDISHLPPEVIEAKLPDVTDFARVYLGVEPTEEGIPIQPTAHFTMGGLPTNNDGQAISDPSGTIIPGLYAAGEAACVSVHGANRLGTNSLLELVVFGRRAGNQAIKDIQSMEFVDLPKNPTAYVEERIARIMSSDGKERVAEVRSAMQQEMTDNMSVVREESGIRHALESLSSLKNAYQHVTVDDKGKIYNTELMEALELEHMLEVAEVMAHGALARQESRGAHFRNDFQKRDDANWLRHTMIYKTSDGIREDYKPVTITRFEPKERKY